MTLCYGRGVVDDTGILPVMTDHTSLEGELGMSIEGEWFLETSRWIVNDQEFQDIGLAKWNSPPTSNQHDHQRSYR
jgi:hypothetical protein